MATYTTVDLSKADFTVPAGVSSVRLSVRGAAGRPVAVSITSGVGYTGDGGLGAGPDLTLAVTAGQVFSAAVGSTPALGLTTTGGSPDGRDSGSGTVLGSSERGGPGGGKTVVSLDGTPVAVGGAGGGAGDRSDTGPADGGHGGTPDGQDGQGAGGSNGGGATQAADGTHYGSSGVFGGGGGGYKLGGSGGSGGPGGGGSSWADASATNVSYAVASAYGDGIATLTYRNPVTPTAPVIVSPTAGSWVGAGTVRLRWLYPMEDQQSAANVEYRATGGSSTPVSITDAANFTDVALAVGAFEWRVQVTSQDGITGPFSPWTPFSTETVLDLPVMTTPTDGGTVTDVTFPVEWTATGQQAWQVQVLDGATIVYDSGQQQETDTRSTTARAPGNNRTDTVRLRIRGAHVWTPWVTASVSVAWVGPDAPVVQVRSDPAAGSLGVEWTQPDGDVAVDHYEIVAVEDGIAFPLPGGSNLAASARSFVFQIPLSDVETRMQVLAVAASGASTTGEG